MKFDFFNLSRPSQFKYSLNVMVLKIDYSENVFKCVLPHCNQLMLPDNKVDTN